MKFWEIILINQQPLLQPFKLQKFGKNIWVINSKWRTESRDKLKEDLFYTSTDVDLFV